MRRFGGTVEDLGAVDPAVMRDWILGVPFEAWPQQDRLADGKIRPAMVNDQKWRGFAEKATSMMAEVSSAALRCALGEGGTIWCHNPMLSVVMPGHRIESHVDRQEPSWRGRVHVPLQADDLASFEVEGEPYWMAPGRAYLVNTEREHAVTNDGDLPRVHFMFDVREV